MRPVIQSRQLDLADPNGIFEDQQIGGAGNLVLDGAFVTDGVAFLDVQRQVILDSAGNLSAITFTITGTDEQGRTISEAIAGPNAGSVATSLDFFTVTQIAVSAAVGTDVDGGTNGLGGSIPIPIDQYLNPTNIGLAVTVTGTVDVTVQHTFDDVFSDDPSTLFAWFDHPTLVNVVANGDGNLAFPPKAVRLFTNSGVGTAGFSLIQAGAVS